MVLEGPVEQVVIHEHTYKRGMASFIHRNRLQVIHQVFQQLPLGHVRSLADFGCSNGFIIEFLQQNVFQDRNMAYWGYDHAHELLDLAREKHLPNAEFAFLDLNEANDHLNGRFDMVTCFETLEHVGDYQAGLRTLYRACRPGGLLFITVPNERGLPGIVKYLGRRILRRNAYEDFFERQSELKYFLFLLLNRRIDGFRQPPRDSWGPHLGFDLRCFSRTLLDEYVLSGRCQLLLQQKTWLGFNQVYVLQREQPS